MKSQESQGIISLVGSTGEEMQSWVAVSVIFPILCINGGSVHTREKPLKASLVTFLANDLGTECPYPGIIREDLREGRCEEGTNCDQTKDVQDPELWGSPWVLSAPVGGKAHPDNNVYVDEHNRTHPHHIKDNLVTWRAQCDPHVKDNLVTRDAVGFSLSESGPDTRETREHAEQPLSLPQKVAKGFLANELNSFPPCGCPRLSRSLLNNARQRTGRQVG